MLLLSLTAVVENQKPFLEIAAVKDIQGWIVKSEAGAQKMSLFKAGRGKLISTHFGTPKPAPTGLLVTSGTVNPVTLGNHSIYVSAVNAETNETIVYENMEVVSVTGSDVEKQVILLPK